MGSEQLIKVNMIVFSSTKATSWWLPHMARPNVQIKNLHDYIAQKNQEVSDDDDWEEW